MQHLVYLEVKPDQSHGKSTFNYKETEKNMTLIPQLGVTHFLKILNNTSLDFNYVKPCLDLIQLYLQLLTS